MGKIRKSIYSVFRDIVRRRQLPCGEAMESQKKRALSPDCDNSGAAPPVPPKRRMLSSEEDGDVLPRQPAEAAAQGGVAPLNLLGGRNELEPAAGAPEGPSGAGSSEEYYEQVTSLAPGRVLRRLSSLPPPELVFPDNDGDSSACRIEELRTSIREEAAELLAAYDLRKNAFLLPAVRVLLLFFAKVSYRDAKKPLNLVRFAHALLDDAARAHHNGMYVYSGGSWSYSRALGVATLCAIEETGEVSATILWLANKQARASAAGNPAAAEQAGAAGEEIPAADAGEQEVGLQFLRQFIRARQAEIEDVLDSGGGRKSWAYVRKTHYVAKAASAFFDQIQNGEGCAEISALCRLRATEMRRSTCVTWEHGGHGHVCYRLKLGEVEQQVRCCAENDCYVALPHQLFASFPETSIRRLELFLSTFYHDFRVGASVEQNDALTLDLCQEALVLGGTQQLPHVVIIYLGAGGNGKTARWHLRNGVLGAENGGIMSTSLLFKKDEFRISGGEYINKIHLTLEEVPEGDIEGQTFKEFTGRTAILTRPPYGKANVYISWERTGIWWNLNKFFHMGRGATQRGTRRCKVVDVISEFTPELGKVCPQSGKFLPDATLEKFLQSGEAHAIYHARVLVPFMRTHSEAFCADYLKYPPQSIAKRSAEVVARSLAGDPAIASEPPNECCLSPRSAADGAGGGQHISVEEAELRSLHARALKEHRRFLPASHLQLFAELSGGKRPGSRSRLTKEARFRALMQMQFGSTYFRPVVDVSGHGRKGDAWEIVIPGLNPVPRYTERGRLGPYFEKPSVAAIEKFLAENAGRRKREEVEAYLREARKGGSAGVQQNYRYKYEECDLPITSRRICCNYALSFPGFTREARAAATSGLAELGLVNCYPTLALHLMSVVASDLSFPALTKYVRERDRCLESVAGHYGFDRAAAKLSALKAFNGGSIRSEDGIANVAADADEAEAESKAKMRGKPPHALLDGLKKEGAMIAYVVREAAPDVEQFFRRENRERPSATALSYVLQSMEDTALRAMEDAVVSSGGEVQALLYDGIIVGNAQDVAFFPTACERRIQDALGVAMKVSCRFAELPKAVSFCAAAPVIPQDLCCVYEAIAQVRGDFALRAQQAAAAAGVGPHSYSAGVGSLGGGILLRGCGYTLCSRLPAGSYVLHQRSHAVGAVSKDGEVSVVGSSSEISAEIPAYAILVTGSGEEEISLPYADDAFLLWEAGAKRKSSDSAPAKRKAAKRPESSDLPGSDADAVVISPVGLKPKEAPDVDAELLDFRRWLSGPLGDEVRAYGESAKARQKYGEGAPKSAHRCLLCPCLAYSSRQKLESRVSRAHVNRHEVDGVGCVCEKQLRVVTALADSDSVARASSSFLSETAEEPGQYLERSADFIRRQLMGRPSFNLADGKLGTLTNETAWCFSASGARVILKADAEAMRLKRRGDWYWSKGAEQLLLAYCLDPSVRAQTLTLRSSLEQHFLRAGCASGICVPGRQHLLEAQEALASEEEFAGKMRSLHAQAEAAGEYVVISIDATFKIAMSAQGQSRHGAKKIPASAAVAPDAGSPSAELHSVFTARGLTGYLVGVSAAASECPLEVSRFLRTISPSGSQQTQLLVTDNPRNVGEAVARQIFPSLQAIAADPMRRPFELEQCLGKARAGSAQEKLRVLHAKFSAPVPRKAAATWFGKEEFFGKESKGRLLARYGALQGVLSQTCDAEEQANLMSQEGFASKPFGSREEYFQCVYALRSFYSDSLGKKNRKGVTADSVLRNALRPKNFLWLLNNLKFRAVAAAGVRNRMSRGTCTNEALHREMLSWGRCARRQSSRKLITALRYFHLAKCLSFIAATKFPLSRSAHQAEFLRLLCGDLARRAAEVDSGNFGGGGKAAECVSASPAPACRADLRKPAIRRTSRRKGAAATSSKKSSAPRRRSVFEKKRTRLTLRT